MTELTSETVVEFWRRMLEAHSAEVVNKADSAQMRIVASVLDTFGVLDSERFLNHFSTTIGHSIYVPFIVGVPSLEWPLQSQVDNGVHECQHVVIVDREGWLPYAAQYADPASRCIIETECYRCNMEMYWWRAGGDARAVDALRGQPARLAAKLREAYACSEEHVAVAQRALELVLADLEAGVIVNVASVRAIEILTELGVSPG